ncbi:hypothetical protein ATANTOWER_012456, partial [Ataeniobius toweri]|nr:hypothetical protein [Ataeniobius toweri]
CGLLSSQCSVSCGRGTKQREIACVFQNQTQIEDTHCSHLPRPRTQKACRAQGCPAWKANRWRECSVTCGSGVQERDVYCRLKGSGQVREDLCNPLLRLASVQVCHTAECTHYSWTVAEWEQCNATCGEGVKSRLVRCMGPGLTPVHDDYCEPSARPSSLQRCREEPCHYMWITGEWSQCSVSCGLGYQQRIISCSLMPSSHSQRFYTQPSTDSKNCPEPHPPATQSCLLRYCPHTPYWKVGPWTKCSQTCGSGVMERRVECVTSKGQLSEHCRPSERPESQAACQERQCKPLTFTAWGLTPHFLILFTYI